MYDLRFREKALPAALLAAGLTLSVSPSTAQTADDMVPAMPRYHAAPRAHVDQIALNAANTLERIAQARADLHADDGKAAERAIAQAFAMLDAIEARLPAAKAKRLIAVANKHLGFEDAKAVVSDLDPIYRSLEELKGVRPMSVTVAHIDSAKRFLQQGDKTLAEAELAAAEADLFQTELELPMHKTRLLLDKARFGLRSGDSKAADEALRQAEDRVVFLAASVEHHMLSAKKALARAHRHYRAGEHALSQAAMYEALSHLEEGAVMAEDSASDKIARLTNDVRALAGRLPKASNNTADAPSVSAADEEEMVSDLEAAWQRTRALADHAMEQKHGGETPHAALRRDLIKAKLYLTYAEAERFWRKEPDLEGADFDKSIAYLNQALQASDGEHRAEVQGLLAAVKALGSQASSGAPERDYKRLIMHMRVLIQTL